MTSTSPRGAGAVVLHPVDVVATALIGVQIIVRLVIVPQSYWWEDDFFHLARARAGGLRLDYLFADYNDHMEVLPNFISWLLTRVTNDAWAPAAVVITLLSLSASAMVYVFLRELFGSRPAILVPLAAYLFSPLLLVSVTWLAAGLQALPLHIALFGCAWGMLRFYRTGRIRWGAIALAFHAFGLLTWEKGALVLPFTLGMQLLVWSAEVPVVQRLAELRRGWYVWAAHLLLLASYASLYLNVVDGSERKPVTGVNYLEAASITLFNVLVPGLFGAPWHRGNAINTLYPEPGRGLAIATALLVAAFVAATLMRRHGGAAGAWFLAAGYVGADIGLMLWGRAGFLDLVARDPRYITDAVPVVLTCAAAAALGPVPRTPQHSDAVRASRPWLSWRALAPAGAVAAVVAAGSLLTTFQLAPVLEHHYARDYVEGVLVRAQPDPGTSILDTPVPKLVSGNVDHRGLLLAMGRRVTFNQASTRMLVFDESSRLVPVTVVHPILQEKGPIADCGWPVGSVARVIGHVPADAGHDRVLRVGNLSGVPGTLTVDVGGVDQAVAVDAGLSAAWFHLAHPEGTITASFEADDGSGTCVSDVLLGAPGR